MARSTGTVSYLPRSRGTLPATLPMPLKRLGVAVQELYSLRQCFGPILPAPGWSVWEWRVACTPILLRLPGVRRSLAELAEVTVSRWPDTGWAVRLRAVCAEVEHRLVDVSTSIGLLVDERMSAIGATDEVATFLANSTKLVRAVDDLCSLIARQYPEAVDAI